jgi:hypothetical protein
MVLGPRALGLVSWDRRCVHSVAETSDNSSDDKLCSCIMALERKCLNCSAENHDCSTNDYAFPAPKSVTEYQHCYGAEKT